MRSRVAALLFLGLLAPDLGARQDERSLWRIYEEKAAGRTPATAHRDAAGKPRFVNALIRERSPYLLDAAHSPVDWLPYSDAAFAKARAQGKLVFVSNGYFSCHWCHVMARESFDDLAIAMTLNRGFVALKMDSEERPDVDRRFLARLEALGISPGWPMNFVLTPDDEMIWGATYVGRDELLATLDRLESRWKTDKPRLRGLAAAREQQVRARALPAPAQGSVADAYARQGARLVADFDAVHKGFGTERKFHSPAELGFLLDAYFRGAEGDYGRLFVETVRALAAGGLNDPIDGGVFRYSVTRNWLQPHFEKMLYDQAQVSRLMCQGHAIAADPALRRAATRILDFTLSAFSTPSGLFAGSFDAESEGSEGGYYLWSDSGLERLSPRARRLVDAHFRRAPQASGDFLLVPDGTVAAEMLEPALEELRAIRRTRQGPRRDDKAITAWNANMVAALAECAGLLDESRYAAQAATRMRALLRANAPDGRLHRYSIAGSPQGAATIEDLAWVLAALVSLHDADRADEWIGHARRFAAGIEARGEGDLKRELGDFARDRTGLSASGRARAGAFAAGPAHGGRVIRPRPGPGFAADARVRRRRRVLFADGRAPRAAIPGAETAGRRRAREGASIRFAHSLRRAGRSFRRGCRHPAGLAHQFARAPPGLPAADAARRAGRFGVRRDIPRRKAAALRPDRRHALRPRRSGPISRARTPVRDVVGSSARENDGDHSGLHDRNLPAAGNDRTCGDPRGRAAAARTVKRDRGSLARRLN